MSVRVKDLMADVEASSARRAAFCRTYERQRRLAERQLEPDWLTVKALCAGLAAS